MDPRPYEFAYRRPRPHNLTFQSYGLSESLYHVGAYAKKFDLPPPTGSKISERPLPNPESIQDINNSRWKVKEHELPESYIYPKEIRPNRSQTFRQSDRLSKSLVFEQKDLKQPSPSLSNSSFHLKNERDSLSAWTSSLTKQKGLQGQDRVYEYQQKPYDIVNLMPKQEPNGHRIYPRFSLEHRLKG